MRQRPPLSLFAFVAGIGLATLIARSALGGISASGNVAPGNPTTWTSSTIALVGDDAPGTVAVAGGSGVNANFGYVGYLPLSAGTVTIDGIGSRWTTARDLAVGQSGIGSLTVSNGGIVSNRSGYIAARDKSAGVVNVVGAGSTWTNSLEVRVGYIGAGTLTIVGGGAVTAPFATIDSSKSLLAIDVGRGSSLVVGGGGQFFNGGTLRLLAGAGVSVGATATPISAGTWAGAGGCQSVGGTWNATSHQFTASTVQAGTSNLPVSVDLALKQRVMIVDAPTGWSLGASFAAAATSSSLTLTAAAISGTSLSALRTSLAPSQSVLNGWSFTAIDGYAAGDLAYLSFKVGAGYSSNRLEMWRCVGSAWTMFLPTDLNYDGTYLNFTATSPDAMAVVCNAAATPSPLSGDANGDGTVNSADLGLLLTHYNQTFPAGTNAWASGDFNSDGTINSADLGLLLTHYNQTAAATAVPEPSTLVMLLGATIVLYLCRRRFSV